jgi:hypothetical protein
MSKNGERQQEILPTPRLPNGGVFTVSSSIVISAPASRVFAAIVDTSNYDKWNTFVPSVEIPKQPSDQRDNAEKLSLGTDMIFTAYMKPGGSGRTNPIQVTMFDSEAYKICWKFNGGYSWLLRSERVQEMTDKEDGTCEYRTWETFAGPLAYIVRLIYNNDLHERFNDWGSNLKRYVEEEWLKSCGTNAL